LYNPNESQKMKVNQILYTKDGRYVGNAIITKITGESITAKTDYGNEIHLSLSEISKFYHTESAHFLGQPIVTDETHKHYTKQ